MKNRLVEKIAQAGKSKEKLFCAFLTLGYPSLAVTEKLILGFEKAGVDIIELGFPFSDPLADGPTIQYSSEQALKRGIGMADAYRLVAKLRRNGCGVPIVFFSYINPILSQGLKAFVAKAKVRGFDGLIIPDLPPEEEPELEKISRRYDMPVMRLAAPTTDSRRAALIAKKSRGFVYFVSLRGVTGARSAVPADIHKILKALKRSSRIPVLIGFGVSNPEQAKKLAAMSQGVIVGSAIINRLRSSGGRTEPVIRYVRKMVKAVKSVSQ